uniref:Uncharacterized protein n=1 Tax=Heterorhabditis bacteriophora TaxID=37862 RepID=A0A1I7X5I7_HETBA
MVLVSSLASALCVSIIVMKEGEKLSFRCQDASDATYCRQSSTFETFLAKYRRDGYKAKAYIHQVNEKLLFINSIEFLTFLSFSLFRIYIFVYLFITDANKDILIVFICSTEMISRCFATSICNVQNGLLNSTIIEDEEIIEKTTKINRLRLLTRSSKASQKTTTVIPLESEDEDGREELSTTIKRRKAIECYTYFQMFTVGQKSKPSSKYIPFWQRLLSTTASTRSEEDTEGEILFEKDARSEIPNIEEINKKVDTEDAMEESTASSKENQVALLFYCLYIHTQITVSKYSAFQNDSTPFLLLFFCSPL